MILEDTYKTIEGQSESVYTEKRSKFIAIAIPVRTLAEIKQYLEEYQKKYYDARHVCYAYMLGAERKDFRANDNGEPSGTAGKPILGQINSNELTDILVIVVRYFGGIKLGTSGLIVAYRTVAAQAIAEATVIEKTVDQDVTVAFEYPFMNDVMRIVKEESPEILEQSYDMDCFMRLRIRKSLMPRLRSRLEKVETLRFPEDDVTSL
ncbi:IMPACT family protein [Phocaeicola coprocola]|uniref:IMPACT family protein n=1 Tax=Phocaeicola coprocola TaxID=310298 RepID=UPI003979E05E